MKVLKTQGFVLVALVGSVLGAVTAPASAAEIDRHEYMTLAEPICKTNVLANKRIFRGVKGKVKAGKLKSASTHFFRAATAFERTIDQLEKVPRPTADEARLAKWFGLLRDEKSIIEKIGRALAKEDRHKAGSYSVDLNRNSSMANNSVLGFGFDYCRIDAGRFG